MTELSTTQIVDNVAQVKQTIADACARVDRNPDEVTLVAVSKKKPQSDVLSVASTGVQHFGENRVEESQTKIPAVNEQVAQPLIWHMVGHIQSRKARYIPHLFDVIHSVDSVKLADKLSSVMTEAGAELAPLDVLIQMNVSGEEQKYGFEAFNWDNDTPVRDQLWSEFAQLIALPGIRVHGLMTMAPFVDDMEQTRPVFKALYQLRAALMDSFDITLPDLSMGMTDDYPVAIEEGATIVRVGRAIFGERQY